MGKKNSILRALSVLSLEDILKLSSAEEEILAFQQVAGGEWTVSSKPRRPRAEAKVLTFPTRSNEAGQDLRARDIEPLREAGEDREIGGLNELSLDFILSQRKLWKQGVANLGLLKAIDEYISQIQAISIKEKTMEGKERIRFITTRGALIDKKQS